MGLQSTEAEHMVIVIITESRSLKKKKYFQIIHVLLIIAMMIKVANLRDPMKEIIQEMVNWYQAAILYEMWVENPSRIWFINEPQLLPSKTPDKNSNTTNTRGFMI